MDTRSTANILEIFNVSIFKMKIFIVDLVIDTYSTLQADVTALSLCFEAGDSKEL